MNDPAWIARNVARKRAARCRHFNGVQHDKCEAGICYGSLTVGGRMLPCLPWHVRAGKLVASCDKYAPFSAEEISEQERQIDRSISRIATARNAIVAELNRRLKAGDKTVVSKPHHDDDFSETGCQSAYVAGAGAILCPICKTGALRYSRAACNGHVHARCSADGCVAWME